jgi:putative transcriptional regulator
VGPLSGERWTAVVPGLVQRIELGVELDGRPVTLARVRGGLGIPRHAHQGRELTLVLSGGLIDRGEDYERGDFALAEVGDEHEPEIQDGTPCLLLAVTEAPTLPRGWYSRVVDWLAG